MLKNQYVVSNKYKSHGKVVLKLPHVIVFMNEDPDRSKLSEDRYIVWDVAMPMAEIRDIGEPGTESNPIEHFDTLGDLTRHLECLLIRLGVQEGLVACFDLLIVLGEGQVSHPQASSPKSRDVFPCEEYRVAVPVNEDLNRIKLDS